MTDLVMADKLREIKNEIYKLSHEITNSLQMYESPKVAMKKAEKIMELTIEIALIQDELEDLNS